MNKKLKTTLIILFSLILIGLWVQSTAWFRLQLADYYEQKYQKEKAVQMYEKVLRKRKLTTDKILSVYPNLSDKQRYFLHKKLADYYFRKYDKNKAIKHYKFVKKIHPDKKRDYLNLYILKNKIAKLAKIILSSEDKELVYKLPKDFMESPLWKFNFAIALVKKNRWNESEGIFKKLVEKYPYLDSFRNCLESVKNKKVPKAKFPIIGIYNFDTGKGNTLKDASGMRNHGKIYGAGWDKGIDGYALNFDGESDRVIFPDNQSMHLDGQNFTIAMWVKPVPQGKHRFVYHKWRPNLYLYKDDKTWSFELQDAGGFKPVSLSSAIKNKWYFVVQSVKQGKEHKAWLFDRQGLIDSVSREDIGITKGSNGKKFKLSRKGWHRDDNAWFEGCVGKVYVFKEAVSNKEIERLYDFSKGGR